MTTASHPRFETVLTATLATLVMLGGGLQIAAVRPYFGDVRHFGDGSMHAFMSVNMLGAALLSPIIASWADRNARGSSTLVVLATLDALLLAAFTLPLSAAVVLALRVLQGATNVGALSIALGSMGRGRRAGARASAIGLTGGGIMFGVAFGPSLGALLLRVSPSTPFVVASALMLIVAGLAAARSTTEAPRASTPIAHRPIARLLRLPEVLVPSALAFAERFTVGCFVVTFSLYAHRVRHLSDSVTALHYSLFLLPFAGATYPLARLARNVSRRSMFVVGGVMYAAAFVAFGLGGGTFLQVALVTAGIASATIYAPSLACLGDVDDSERATAMGLFHAAGCVGMFLGPAVAGMTSALLARPLGDARFAAVFGIAAFVQLVVLVAVRAPLAMLAPHRLVSPAAPAVSQ